MSDYQVRYEIITLDTNEYTEEVRNFSTQNDERAKDQARQIVADRMREIERKGGACNTRNLRVLRVEHRYHLVP